MICLASPPSMAVNNKEGDRIYILYAYPLEIKKVKIFYLNFFFS